SFHDKIQVLIVMYAPLDGMNEKEPAVSVNMIHDSATISQNTGKLDITTTTAIRLLLNKAANIKETIELLQQYDMHACYIVKNVV
ncbi:MAG: linear amide C-N hydrolase, partial [Oscillospiraceae bacterium]|nr:linear amide C-N hydrolase [Oscillospiraceae bacterium]